MSAPRFSLSENPMMPGSASEGGAGLFIIHHIDPIAIIEADIYTAQPVPKLGKVYSYHNSDGAIEEWLLVLRHMFKTLGEDLSDELAMHTIDRAWRWYRSYMEWEDKNIDNN